MWVYNSDYGKWEERVDGLLKSDFDYLKQQLSATRFYSRFLSGAIYTPITDTNNLYPSLGVWKPRSWFISSAGSINSISDSPVRFPVAIDSNSSFEFYTKFMSEYGVTTKGLFTPKRLIRDLLQGIIKVDVATTGQIIIGSSYTSLTIDGILLKKGNRVLVKDQVIIESIDSTMDPSTYFKSKYTILGNYGSFIQYSYKGPENGIYTFDGSKLVKDTIFDDYNVCLGSVVYVESGSINSGKEFYLDRLLDGYHPTSSKSEPMSFVEGKSRLLRNSVDYNNIFDLSLNVVIEHGESEYYLPETGITYSIPERKITCGEFGTLIVTQNGTSTIPPCKYKETFRSIDHTKTDYWVCGDNGTLLKFRKHDFEISSIDIVSISTLRSVSFYDDLRGIVVGDQNTILLTLDGGQTWKGLRIDDFDGYSYNTVIFAERNLIYIGGRHGVFIELEESTEGWSAYKRRISKIVNDEDEILLVDNIRSLVYTKIDTWNLSYNYLNSTPSVDKRLLFMSTDGGEIIVYDIDNSTIFDFIYMNFPLDYGDISSIRRKGSTNNFIFGNNSGVWSFDINSFTSIGIGNSYSNTIMATSLATPIYNSYVNDIFDYNGQSITIVGNGSLYLTATYSGNGTTEFQNPDPTLMERLRSRLLFLDYDMASKLNFFTDSGEYRLPSTQSFDVATTGGYSLSYTASNVNIPTVPNVYYGTPIIDSITIPANNIGTYPTKGVIKEFRVKVNIQTQNASLVSIALRKKNKGTVSVLKYGQAGISSNLELVFTDGDWAEKVHNLTQPYTGKTAKMDLTPPTFQIFDSYIVDSKSPRDLMYVNGVWDVSGEWELIVSNFDNNNTMTLLDWSIEVIMERSTFSISPIPGQTNWWTYWSDSQKTFEFWSESTPSDSNVVVMSNTFSSYSSYSNNSPQIITIPYARIDSNDLNLLVPPRDTSASKYYRGSGNNIDLVNSAPLPFYLSPGVMGPSLYLGDGILVLETDTQWSVSVGDLIRIESSVVDANLLVNKIISVGNRRFIWAFTTFNQSIANSLSTTQISVRNLNRYLDETNLVDNFKYHPMSNAWDLSYVSGVIYIKSKFGQLTSYYNLQARVNWSGVELDMVYEDSFLRFGYSPTYNILDYLSSIDSRFYGDKEYYALPHYEGLVMQNPLTSTSVFIDSGIENNNKIVFGSDLSLEWESLMINTFVDITIKPVNGSTFSSSGLFVMKKYQVSNYSGSGQLAYVVEFDKKLNFVGDLTDSKIGIKSRRKLSEISEDLKLLNNIQKPLTKISDIDPIGITYSYTSFEKSISSKFPTDSYAKVMLSDSDTVDALSGIFYIDYKNEMSMNITKMDREYNIPISNTGEYSGKLYLSCSEKHGLKMGDPIVLEFDGATYSSQVINQQYFGYKSVLQIVSEYDLVVDTPYGSPVYIGNDTGKIRYLRRDPFLSILPVDVMDVGSDKKAGLSVKVSPKNVILTGSTFSLNNVDYSKYRMRLVDGLTLDKLSINYPWILEAEVSDAVIGQDSSGNLVWYKGVWESGRWFGGTWISGTWKYGDWYAGSWNSLSVSEKGLSVIIDENSTGPTNSIWITGRWFGGTWEDGSWYGGRWYNGTWNGGRWYNGTWNDGIWTRGNFSGGIWVQGSWLDGVFNCNNESAYWVDGNWKGGDFDNGIWYGGIFGEDNTQSTFGAGAYSSRIALWYGGKWKSGSFYSGRNLSGVSPVHKYSVWHSGIWSGGDFWGGIVYNIDFNSGIWHGGILEDIEIVGMNSLNNSYILNGIFRFNLGDKLKIVDGGLNNEYSKFGSDSTPGDYMVLDTQYDEVSGLTEVYVDSDIDTLGLSSYKVNSGPLNLQIPNTTSYLVHTQSVTYDVNSTDEIRVKLNLFNQNMGDLIINLKSPNGEVINIKNTLDVSGNSSMVDTIFTTATASSFTISSSPYTGIYEMSKVLNVGSDWYKSSSLEYTSLTDSNNGVSGDWTLFIQDNHKDVNILHNPSQNSVSVSYTTLGDRYQISISPSSAPWFNSVRVNDLVTISLLNGSSISASFSTTVSSIGLSQSKFELTATASSEFQQYFNSSNKAFANIHFQSNPNPSNVLIDWEIEFVNNIEVGAQLGKSKTNGFDTGLRAVSYFKDSRWESGIWSNGIFDDGLFEGGMWLGGVFNGTWG